tara:strand:+ start:3382 stop:3993 length:612 start_codon:yes stop_codon:yes gene_type:complete
MISHKHKFIFIHVPKNAGTSIEISFKRNGHADEYFPQNVEVHHDFVDKKIANSYYTFAVKRNPWDRFISIWSYWTINSEGSPRGEAIGAGYRNISLQKFANVLPIIENTVKEKYPLAMVHFMQQTELNQLPPYVTVDMWIEYNNIQEDFNTVCDKIGIPHQKLPHYNKTKHKHYTEYYDDETKQLVAEKYAKDIEYFGYKFGE